MLLIYTSFGVFCIVCFFENIENAVVVWEELVANVAYAFLVECAMPENVCLLLRAVYFILFLKRSSSFKLSSFANCAISYKISPYITFPSCRYLLI